MNKKISLNNFNGKEYFHQWSERKKTLLTVLKWQWTSKKMPWPKKVLNSATPNFKLIQNESDVGLTFINHATVFIQHAGLNMITDPHWGLRCSPVSFAGPKRVREAGAAIDALPSLDYVFVSHNHYDHLDIQTLIKLNQLYQPTFLIGKGDGKLLLENGISKFKELDWWDEFDLGSGCKAIYVPVKHWSARGAVQAHLYLQAAAELATTSFSKALNFSSSPSQRKIPL